MNAIEFQSTVSNGIIKLPEQYKNRRFDNARIIVLGNASRTVRKKKVSFTDFGLIMPTDYKFDREEANARR